MSPAVCSFNKVSDVLEYRGEYPLLRDPVNGSAFGITAPLYQYPTGSLPGISLPYRFLTRYITTVPVPFQVYHYLVVGTKRCPETFPLSTWYRFSLSRGPL